MKKIPLLVLILALVVPLSAHAFYSDDQLLSYAAMPLAVDNVCAVRGVQTDQVANLVAYMDQANIAPDQFIEVFRYVPVALVLNNGRRPDFVQWVGGQVQQGIVGDQLVSMMEDRLTTYGSNRVVTVSAIRRHRRPRYYETVYEPDYVPVDVQRYCDYELADPLALIDMPIAVSNVVDLGVPIARVGNLVLQLDLGYVAPVQEVEVLRYAPTALLAVDYGQPDFVQYVYDQRIGGLTGFDLVRAVDRQLPQYGVAPQIDFGTPVYVGANTYVPSVVQNYVPPVEPAFVPAPVRTRMAAFAQQPAVVQSAPNPQVQRLLEGRGNSVVLNPAQARREIAQSQAAGRGRGFAPPAMINSPTQAPVIAQTPGRGVGRGRQAPVFAAQPQPQPSMIARGRGHMRGGAPAVATAPVIRQQPQVNRQHGRPQFVAPQQPVMAAPRGGGQGRGRGRSVMVAPQPQPQQPVFAAPRGGGQGHGRGHGGGQPAMMAAPQPQPVMAAPRGGGEGHGRGHGGPPPAVMAAPPQPAPVAAPAPAPQGRGQGQGQGQGQGKDHKKGHES